MSTNYILAIETSCDETATAVVAFDTNTIRIRSNIVASQIPLHRKTFGVVPEIASRAHTEKIIGVIEHALKKANITINDITAIAVTTGPGLIGSLLVGSETAKAIAYTKRIPIIPINHLEGHIIAAFVAQVQSSKFKMQNYLPALALIVSGGHTELVLIKKPFQYQIVGQTVDDAAGEAFDKIAHLLGLSYPGGPAIAAEAAKLKVTSEKLKVELPRPKLTSKDSDFSFSGLKTAVLYALKKESKLTPQRRARYAYETQAAIVEVLTKKTYRAAQQYGVKTVLLAGGVSANTSLRNAMQQKFASTGIKLLIAPKDLTTDNAAMIGLAGAMRYLAAKTINWYDVSVDPNAKLTNGY